jgi:predicted alpha/beta-hydrolase family hydrolase
MVERPILILAPGAGAPCSHPWMRRWADLLNEVGIVWAFDYPYMKEGRSRPDPLPKLIASHGQALQQASESHSGPKVLIGKSMGSRVGCHLALQEEITAVICLGYPLCGGADRNKLRERVLLELRTPVLFVQGSRDPLCPLDLLQSVREEMRAVNRLYIVRGGDHSLTVPKSQLKESGQTQEFVDRGILQEIQTFLNENTARISN